MSRRVERVERELREVVANFILTGLKASLEGLVTVSRVQASPDLKSARVFVSTLSDEEDARTINVETLNNHKPSIQREVNSRLQMKFCPKLLFINDKSTDNVLKVESILSDLKKEN